MKYFAKTFVFLLAAAAPLLRNTNKKEKMNLTPRRKVLHFLFEVSSSNFWHRVPACAYLLIFWRRRGYLLLQHYLNYVKVQQTSRSLQIKVFHIFSPRLFTFFRCCFKTVQKIYLPHKSCTETFQQRRSNLSKRVWKNFRKEATK